MTTSDSDHMQTISLKLDSDQIAVIRTAHEVVGQSDEQIASGVVVSYIERSLAKPHLSIWSWAYVPLESKKTVRLKLSLTEGQLKRLDDIANTKRIGRASLVRWIIADTAAQVGYPR